MLHILFRDQHFIAIHKPAGLLVHRSEVDRHETRFAIQLLRDQIGQHVWPVHRLDRGTSGVLLFALDKDALTAASRQFESGLVTKEYMAVVRGWPASAGLIDYPLRRIREEDGHDSDAPAQEARTHFQRLATLTLEVCVDRYPTSRYALLRLQPETGRRHQLRRHLKHIAHPIIGDATYGKGAHNRLFQQTFSTGRLLLACTALHLHHPLEGTQMNLVCPPADDFKQVLAHPNWVAENGGVTDSRIFHG
ncbi:pseudouridine synthase [Viridibacterium curvum]|uniref:tRNA pseudouridine synthase C n=1 Tax=Viridibacterium curvum TaxID=1101404 RepID=A0ABP9R9E9_9RHOO